MVRHGTWDEQSSAIPAMPNYLTISQSYCLLLTTYPTACYEQDALPRDVAEESLLEKVVGSSR